MPSTTPMDLGLLSDEFLNRLRWVLNSSDSQNRISETTKNITIVSGQDIYLLDNLLSYIKRVTIVDVSDNELELLEYGKDYRILYYGDDAGSIEVIKTLNEDDIIKCEIGVINTGKGNFVFSDHPYDNINQKTMPRVGFELTKNSSPGGNGGGSKIAFDNDILVQIKFVDTNTKWIIDAIQVVESHLKQYLRTFYNFRYITPSNLGNTQIFGDNTSKSKSKMIQYNIVGKKEIVDVKKLV